MRCLKFGIECDGYLARSASKAARKLVLKAPNIRALAPKDTPPNIQLLYPLQSTTFANEQEYRYFRLFCEKTASGLGGYFNAVLWTELVLQACEDTPPIRHAIIAIGALDRTLDTTRRVKSVCHAGGKDCDSESAQHHQFALHQYGKAIKRMKDLLATGTQDFRKALILCLLTVCFEALNGDMQLAMAQIRNGLKLIKEWKQSRTSSSSYNAIGAEKPDESSSELIRAFARLDNDSMMLQDVEPVNIYEQNKPENIHSALCLIPERFHSLYEARSYFEFLAGRMLHWIASAFAWGASGEDRTRGQVQTSTTLIGNDGLAASRRDYIAQQKQQHLTNFTRWRSSFQPLWLYALSPAGHEDFAAAITLEMRYKALDTSLRPDFFKGDTSYDAYYEQFQEIINLAKILIGQEKAADVQHATFTFDDPIISSLYVVVLKCRHPIIRRQAIAMLESRPRREGVMDSALMARIGSIQMAIEEKGAGEEGKFIPEYARIRGIKSSFDMATRTGHMKYLRMAPGSKINFVENHLDFTW